LVGDKEGTGFSDAVTMRFGSGIASHAEDDIFIIATEDLRGTVAICVCVEVRGDE
jgi:hypothetical protein